MKRLILVASLATGSVAIAQERSDLMPPVPEPAAGQQVYVPGMPLPQPVNVNAAPAGAAAGAGKQERKGLVITDDQPGFDTDYSGSGSSAPEAVPETYTVVKGDTLWDLSSRYYRNPYQWPRLWAYNPAITNPHWIYPGDTVRLLPPGTAVALPTSHDDQPHRIQGGMRTATGVFLRQTGFVEPHELKEAGKIVGSKEEKTMLGTLDEAYVEFPKDRPFVVGERYTVYRPTDKVHHPQTGKYLGQMVEIFGEGEVRAVTDGHIARVALVDSVNPIERGFLVGPLRRQFKVVQPRADKGELQGVIVATLHPRDMVSNDNLVFIDRGSGDGIEVGNRFLVVRRGDGYQPVLSSGPIDDKRFPRETIAEIVVVDVREHLCTGIVTKANHESRIGDRVETRAGY